MRIDKMLLQRKVSNSAIGVESVSGVLDSFKVIVTLLVVIGHVAGVYRPIDGAITLPKLDYSPTLLLGTIYMITLLV